MGRADEFDEVEWDQEKSLKNLDERGFDFEAAAAVLDGISLQRESSHSNDGEPRYVATGRVEGISITVVWTPRGRSRRIITAWPASRRERREYLEYLESIERADPQA